MSLKSCALAAVVSAVSLTVLTSPSWAANRIDVVEGGEGGAAMSLKLVPSTVKAGPALFSVRNDAATEEHEMIVVKLRSADEMVPVAADKRRVDEDQLQSLGEVEDLKPGATGELSADLAPGTYLVFCNIKGHYEAGMQA